MKATYLRWDQTLFRDAEVFEFDHLPDAFRHRERQMKELAFLVAPGLRGGRPLSAICFGLPGTGKTTCMRKLFAEIEETTRSLVPMYINCQVDHTKLMVFSKIYLKLTGHLPQTSGVPVRKVLDAIARHMIKEGRVLVVCLDDANFMQGDRTLSDTLYTLLRTHEEYPGTRIGVIATVSDVHHDLAGRLDPCVVSVFRPSRVYFDPYTEEEVREILAGRVRQGLYPGVVPEAMLDLIVAQTMKCGDLRVGLDILKRSVLAAEHDGRTEVAERDIMAAYEMAKHVHLVASVRALSPPEKRLLLHIAKLALDEDGEMTSGRYSARPRSRCG